MADTLSALNHTQWLIITACLSVLVSCISTYFVMIKRQQRVALAAAQSSDVLHQQISGLTLERSELHAHIEQLNTDKSHALQEKAHLQGELAQLGTLQAQLKHQQAHADDLNRTNASLKTELAHVQAHVDQQKQLIEQARVEFTQEFERLSDKIFQEKHQLFKSESRQHLSHTVDPLKEKIGEFKLQIEQFYSNENANRHQLIGKIGELQQQTLKIGEDAVNLATALKGENKLQGLWGEIVLERLLEDSGLVKGREYDVQVASKGQDGKTRNPDVVIFLPDDKHLIVDAKMSLLHYEQLVAEKDSQVSAQLIKAHTDSIKQHIVSLSKKKYEDLLNVNTVDFVFIFIPIDAAFIAALNHAPDVFKFAYDKNIVLVSPSTLMATLRTVANLWQHHKQHKNAEKIADQAGGIYDQFALVIDSLEDLGKQIDKTQTSYEQTKKRLYTGNGNMVKKVEQLKKLGAKTKREVAKSALTASQASTLSLIETPTNEDKVSSD